MSYKDKTIRDAVEELNRTIFLPAIQREFVWTPEQIEKLFDSIMGDFPIGSFLFWKINEEQKKDWVIYSFIRNFNQDDPHNEEANLSGVNNDIYLVLDGQQRLTSLLTGLKGSYRYFYYKWRKTKLYLNLFKKPVVNENDPEELVYNFEFRESSETNKPEKEYWYDVGKILDFLDPEDAKEDLNKKIHEFPEPQKKNARKLIGRLHSRIHIYPIINFYEEKSENYDKVVQVFIRSNTGGKILEYSDILLSTATAKWKNLNAREEIHNFTDSLNNIGNGYNFGKDLVLKGSLYLTESLPIQYKVKNFTRKNLEKIEENWINIKTYLESAVKLISKFGYSSKNLTSNAALLPISFYLFKTNNSSNFINSSETNDVLNQTIIQRWLNVSLIKQVFGGSSDNTLRTVRQTLQKTSDDDFFPAELINNSLSVTTSFDEGEIENALRINYGTRYSYLILSILYPNRDWKDNHYHEDHIFPKSEFTSSKLKKRFNGNEEKIEYYKSNYNSIANLQLITSSENQEKGSSDFEPWINSRDKNFKERHLIPKFESYKFNEFPEFIKSRKKLIAKSLDEFTF